eukprot:scaffold65090_cov43-Attheya_sp.AAC.1
MRTKEILGWLFDGATRCIELPADKQERMQIEIKSILCTKRIPRKRLETIVGKLRHAAIGIPAGRGLFGPINDTLAKPHEWFPLSKSSSLRLALNDWRYLLQVAALNDWRYLLQVANIEPTHCKELVPGDPGYIGYCDAAKRGMGGVWLSGTKQIFQQRLVSWSNPKGDITNSDLEMAAHLMRWLALEFTHD